MRNRVRVLASIVAVMACVGLVRVSPTAQGAMGAPMSDEDYVKTMKQIGPAFQSMQKSNAAMEHEADMVRGAVEEKLGAAPVDVDEIVRQCGAPAAAVLTVLLELELAGQLARHPGNRVSWR